jgi:ABC transporter substrate binding protein (PQQ-dependent alcohol dehydrogenase system)
LRLSDAVKDKDVLLFNVRATDENLRQEDCRANVLHTAPDRAMLADALAQYLVWKKWSRWLVAKGVFPEDRAYLEALHRAAKRFGGTIVEEREYEETPGARRSDSGQLQIQRQMPVFTQGAPSYDVLVVADEKEIFGPYLPYRTWDPRPVAGTAGLQAMSWHPAHEQWGATQMQNRFQRAAKRFMLPLDYQAWVAVRAIGESASRVGSGDFTPVNAFLRGDEFGLAAFKGQKVTFRRWDGQLRQPIIIAGPDLPVSMSPQEGFLHEHAEVDTLGIDEPESKCKFH